jgi:hypothetical protein
MALVKPAEEYSTNQVVPTKVGTGGMLTAPITQSQPKVEEQSNNGINGAPSAGIPRVIAANGNLNGDGLTSPNTNYNYTSSAATSTPSATTQQAVLAPEVKPQTGTAATYNATTAKGAPDVVAGTKMQASLHQPLMMQPTP